MSAANVKRPASPEFLDQKLSPLASFKDKLRAIVAVPQSELAERLAAEKATKPKRGRKPKVQ